MNEIMIVLAIAVTIYLLISINVEDLKKNEKLWYKFISAKVTK